MEQCTSNVYGGQGGCFALLEPIASVFILEKDHTAITKANAKTLDGWKTLLAPATLDAVCGAVLDGMNGVEPTGGENEITVSNLGYSVRTNTSLPILTFYAKMTYADYLNYYSMESKSFQFALLDAKKTLYGTKASNTNFTGFRGHFELKHGLPPVGADKIKSYPFFIYFDDIEEWGGNTDVIRTDFSYVQAVEDLNPIGIDIEVKTPIANTTGLVVIKATYRNSTRPYAGLTTTSEWALKSVTDVGTTLAVNNFANAAIGEYTLAILSGVPGNITGDVVIQGYKVVGGAISYLSNALTINKYTA
ncbi:MAG TPA: hypothetical protein DCS19_01330 [Flavobacterium sp.]|nr:hypothetical protein [Flavobacterium sp.]